MPANDQLARILYILPAAARRGGIALDDLARALEVDAATLVKDVQQVIARDYYHPAGWVGDFSISLEPDRVTVHAPAEFTRPVRLSAREAFALQLGLRTLAAEANPSRRSAILALAERLEEELKAPVVALQPRLEEEAAEYQMAAVPLEVELGEDDVRGMLADAIGEQRICTIAYVKPAAEDTEAHEIAPQMLIYANGRWYVAAYDITRRGTRVFRLDRIVEIASGDRLEDVRAAALKAAVQDRQQVFLTDAEDEEAVIRYSPRIAPWIAERLEVEPTADGGARATYQVGDPRWLVRHVLQYGGEAVVETPPYRELVARAANRLSRR